MASQKVDALLVPATRVVAPRLTDRFERSDLTGYTRPFNTTRQPAISLPAPAAEIPIGIQVIGRHGMDLKLLQIAMALEKDWAALVYEGVDDAGSS